MWQFADLRFKDPIFFPIADPVLFADLKLQQIWKIFYKYKYKYKLRIVQFEKFYQTNLRPVRWYWHKKGHNFLQRFFILSVLWWKICRFSISGLEQQWNLRIWKVGIIHTNFQICNLRTGIPKNFKLQNDHETFCESAICGL
jgi:hypothetical protein